MIINFKLTQFILNQINAKLIYTKITNYLQLGKGSVNIN